jgi:hypothetical protein
LWNVGLQPEKAADYKRIFQCPRCEYSHDGSQKGPQR